MSDAAKVGKPTPCHTTELARGWLRPPFEPPARRAPVVVAHGGARKLAGEASDYERRHLAAQAYVRREAARVVMKQADAIHREDAIFEDAPAAQDGPDDLACDQ